MELVVVFGFEDQGGLWVGKEMVEVDIVLKMKKMLEPGLCLFVVVVEVEDVVAVDNLFEGCILIEIEECILIVAVVVEDVEKQIQSEQDSFVHFEDQLKEMVEFAVC